MCVIRPASHLPPPMRLHRLDDHTTRELQARLPASSASRPRPRPRPRPAYVRECAPACAPRRPPQATSTTCTASARRPTPGRRCPRPAPAPPRATTWALRRRPTACSTSSEAMAAAVTRGGAGQLRRMGLVARDAAMRRASLSVSFCKRKYAVGHGRYRC